MNKVKYVEGVSDFHLLVLALGHVVFNWTRLQVQGWLGCAEIELVVCLLVLTRSIDHEVAARERNRPLVFEHDLLLRLFLVRQVGKLNRL